MADLLNTSVSGLLAFQRALDTTGHNITNANTAGYSRQLTEFMTRQAEPSGRGWMGNGVDISTIKRAYDEFLSNQSRGYASSFEQANTFATQAERLSNVFGDSSTGLAATLQGLVNAVQGVADTPTSVPARQTLLSQAQTFIDRLQTYSGALDNFDRQVNTTITSELEGINAFARNIAELNIQITSGYARTGQPPNDLLDQRDHLIDELSKHINVNVVEQSDRSVNVFIGAGQPLVLGQTPATMVATSDPYDPTRSIIAVRTAHTEVDITNSLSGGALGGMLDFRAQMLEPARNALGRIAIGLTEVVNDQHSQGVDLRGNFGDDFFAVGEVRVREHANNGGAATLSVVRLPGSASALTTSNYVMTYTASGWALRRTDTNAAVPMTGDGSAGNPFIADGLQITLGGGAAVVGDRMLIEPTATALSGMRVLVTSPEEIAAASPVVTGVAAGNAGTGTIALSALTNVQDPQLQTPATINFVSASQYTIGADPTLYAYTSGADIPGPGWTVRITGNPAAGDSFTVTGNTTGAGDNRNALALADAMTRPVLNGGTTSLNAGVGQFVSEIGVKTNQAQVTRDAQKVVADEASSALQSVSGVNLDEEAANLMRYQQAYMAIAQMVRIADQLFQSVLDATRR